MLPSRRSLDFTALGWCDRKVKQPGGASKTIQLLRLSKPWYEILEQNYANRVLTLMMQNLQQSNDLTSITEETEEDRRHDLTADQTEDPTRTAPMTKPLAEEVLATVRKDLAIIAVL